MTTGSVDGINVVISADTTNLKAGVTSAQASLAGLNTAAATSAAAMQQTSVAANQLGQTTNNLGSTISATGNRRELRESLGLLKSGAMGTADAFEILRAGLVTFGSSLGGPALVAITAGLAALALLVKTIYDASEAQKQLNLDASALRLPADDLKTYTTGMKELATQLMSVQLGLSTLNQGQVNLFKALGVDPADADAGKKIITAIGNEAVDQAEKIRQLSVAFGGIDYSVAKEKLEKFQEESKQSANGWLNDMVTMMSKAASAEAGIDDGIEVKSKGDVNGNKPNTAGTAGTTAKSQKQLDDEKSFQDEHLKIVKEGTQAEIDANATAAQKIIADAELANDQRLKDTADYIAKHTELTSDQKAGLNADTAHTNSQNMGAAQTRAAQVTNEQRIEQEEQFQSQIAALRKAGADSAVGVEMTAGEKIIAEGQAKIDALGEQYLKDVANLQKALAAKKITQDQYNSETSSLGTTFGAAVSQISDNSASKAAQADAVQQEKIDDQLQDYLRNSADTTAKDLKGIKEDETQKIIDEGQIQLQAIQSRYDKELEYQQKMLDSKQENEQTYNANVAAMDAAMEQAKAANATATATKIVAANNAPLNSLVSTWQNTSKQMSQFAADTANNIAGSLVTMMMTGKMNLASLTEAILADLAKIIIEKQLAGIIGGLIGGSSGGVTGDYMLNGPTTGHAGGGTIQAGVPVPVGERGPEMFVPNVGGQIIPNGSLGGGGGVGDIHVMMTNNGTAQTVKSVQPTMSGKDIVLQIITDDLRTGGPISTGVQQKFGLKKQAYM